MERHIFKREKYRKDEALTALAVLAPSLVLLAIFVLTPIVISVTSSFYQSNAYIEAVFVKFQNYSKVFNDPKFWASIGVGFQFILWIVPAEILMSFFIALLITKLKGHLLGVTKVVIYLPCVLSGIVAGAIFAYMFAYEGGLFNFVLSWFGIEKQAWLGDPKLALPSVALAAVWANLGYVTLVMLGGLLDVPRDYYEAATIDGAGSFAKTLYITLPSIKNVAAYLLVSCFVSTFQIFELPFIMTGGKPLDLTVTPVMFLYQHFSWDDTLGYTISASVVIAIVLGAISSLVFKFVNSEKSMD